ncbi:MAG: hypothetical protein QOJ64_1260 [Acidobacteriota bacterium]|nr:hypothetical protein [Acidobacteriota bacterium]
MLEMTIDRIREVVEATYKECFEDYVGLWEIPAQFEQLHGIGDERLRRVESFKVIERLLRLPAIGVGQFRPHEAVFDFWNLSPVEALDRIASEWDELGHEPSLGEIAWFTSRD